MTPTELPRRGLEPGLQATSGAGFLFRVLRHHLRARCPTVQNSCTEPTVDQTRPPSFHGNLTDQALGGASPHDVGPAPPNPAQTIKDSDHPDHGPCEAGSLA